jgi:hypothetical protein
MKDKCFVIRKYVMAPTAAAAIEREHRQAVDEVYLNTPPAEADKTYTSAIGFHASIEPDWREDEIRARRRR